jgi:nicotinamidase-related amidase
MNPAALLERDRAVLVVVDLQQKLLPAIEEKDRVLRNSLLLLRLAQVTGVPVILTTQYSKGLGETLPEVLAAAGAAAPLDKLSFGCFGDDAFLTRLETLTGRDQLIVAGIESHICVAQTVLGAMANGYSVHVASDAVGSRSAANREVGLARMQRAGALLSSAEMATYELLRRSDSAEFKQMLPYLKA